MSEDCIERHARDELPESKTDWSRVDAMTEEEIDEAARSDPDNPPWTEEELARAVLKARD